MDNFDRLLRNENMWFKAAVLVAFFVFAMVIIGTIISLGNAINAEQRGQSIDVVYKLGLIGAGLITFCTVAWRGLIATQQSEMQRLQIDKLSQQIAATEENNLATLLQKGAELIDEEKLGQVAAGIATLQAVATAKNAKFSVEAMNLLADYIQNNHHAKHEGVHFHSARKALEAGNNLGRVAERTVFFEADETADETDTWHSITGVQLARYKGGYAFSGLFDSGKPTLGRQQFNGVTFMDGSMDVHARHFACIFRNIDVQTIKTMKWSRNRFVDCNFSGTSVEPMASVTDIRAGNNWYDVKNPPNGDHSFEWGKYLLPVTEAE
ncbi:hypothetical protein [Aminobacter aminovorans]|uniref:hypothetical protein n=1 Tax=Aminobacter aminovorans TaxID=83263 RepID=UPI002863CD48|nr:hypothetical protein [Aminobacter aminovorans]MDR7223146.1 hypothetical protein [Aminobacter aminovorans]